MTNLNLHSLYFGMETPLFAFLTLLAYHLFTLRKEALTGIVLGLAFLTRYDAALLALLVGLALLFERKKLPFRLAAGFFVVATPWLLFSQLYFHSIVPHALAAKKDYYPAVGYLRQVFAYYQEYFSALAGVFTSSATVRGAGSQLFPVLCLAGMISWIKRSWEALVLIGFVELQVLTYAALGPDPAFRWHYYLLNPVLTLLFLAGLHQVGCLISLPARSRPRLTAALQTAVLLLALLMAGWNLHLRLGYVYKLGPHPSQMFEIADWLRERYSEETSLLQPSIGILGYASGLTMIDHAGLVTPGLYYFDGSNHTPMEDVLKRFAPDLALVPEGADQALRQHDYRPVEIFRDPVTYLLLERPNLDPAHDR